MIRELTKRFGIAALMGTLVLSASFGGAAIAQDRVGLNTPQAPITQMTPTSEIKSVDKRGAWKASKQNGGTLVIWYDARHHLDAMAEVYSLKAEGRNNVVAFAGRTDGSFMLIGNGRTVPHKFTIEDVRNGMFGAEADLFADQQNITSLGLDGSKH